MSASRIEIFKQMMASEPDNAPVRYGLANELMKAERYAEAAAEFEAYLKQADDEGAGYGMLARAYEMTGARDKARAALEQGVKAAETHGHAHTMAQDYRVILETEYADE